MSKDSSTFHARREETTFWRFPRSSSNSHLSIQPRAYSKHPKSIHFGSTRVVLRRIMDKSSWYTSIWSNIPRNSRIVEQNTFTAPSNCSRPRYRPSEAASRLDWCGRTILHCLDQRLKIRQAVGWSSVDSSVQSTWLTIPIHHGLSRT